MPRLVLTNRVRQQLAALSPSLRDAVEQTLSDLHAEPEDVGKPLLGRLRGIWSVRVGTYRLLYTIEGQAAGRRIVVRSLLHRALACKSRRPSSRDG